MREEETQRERERERERGEDELVRGKTSGPNTVEKAGAGVYLEME